MKVLVVGSEGFLGKHLVKKLEQACEVVCVDELGTRATDKPVFLADIRRSLTATGELLGSLPKDITHCVHLAAVASPRIAQDNPGLAWAVNVQGTHNVLKLCQAIGVKKVVFMSSAHVYGVSPKYMPSDEEHPLALHDAYTTTKILGEELCRLFWENYGLGYTTLRLFNGYGPGQSPDYFMAKKIQQARGGKVTLRGGAVTKDWVFVEDVAQAILCALETKYVGPLNVGTGVETSLLDIATQIARSFSVPLELEDDDPSDPGPTRMWCNWGRAANVLGWRPRVAFEEGLARTIEASR